jgi:hypothetical protein
VVAVEPSEVMIAHYFPEVREAERGLATLREIVAVLGTRPPGDRAPRGHLDSGAWERRYGYLRALEETDLGYRLVVSSRP